MSAALTPSSCSLRQALRGPRLGTISLLPYLLISILFAVHLCPAWIFCSSQTSVDCWGVGGAGRGGAGRSNVINVPISLPWIPRICPPFPSSGYTPHPLSLAGNLVPHLRLLFCCQECLMSWLFSWLPVATPESCHGTGNL